MSNPVNTQTDICYVVSHGFAARMILQTDLLGKLVKNGYKISLISPDAKDPILNNYCQKNQIGLFRYQSKKWIWKSNYMLYRSYFLEDIKANPALYEKHYHEMYHSKRMFLRWIPSLLICFYYIFKTFPILRKCFLFFEEKLLHSKSAITLLTNLNPKILVSTYPVNVQEGILLYNAKKLKIKTLIHLLSWDNISCKGYFLSDANYYIAWGPIMKNEFIDKYKMNPDNIFITGVPHFDLHIQTRNQNGNAEILNIFGLDPSKPFLIFGMSSPRFVPKEIDIVEYIAERINENQFGPEIQMIIRPHPQNVKGWMADLKWIERIKALENKRIKIFYPFIAESNLPWSMELDDMQKLSALLASCIVCINSCSTLSIDTLMAGKGNIAPMFDGNVQLPYWNSAKRLLDYNHIKKFVTLGGTLVTSNFEELEHAIKQYLQDPSYMNSKRITTILSECNSTEDNATLNVVSCLENILKTER
ncbi:MAG: hypothetical protein WAS55_11035 [Saprospiraceae bacterium]